MSTNSINGIWQNLNLVGSYDTSTYYYGFVVDYRGTRPTVHLIIEDEVVSAGFAVALGDAAQFDGGLSRERGRQARVRRFSHGLGRGVRADVR